MYVGKDHRRTRVANAYFSLFMALGNILGFATGSYSGWSSILPFTATSACGTNCANLKSAFILDIIILTFTTYISLSSAGEIPLNSVGDVVHSGIEAQIGDDTEEAFIWELLGSFRYLTSPIWIILIVTALTWIGWFPFLLYDTDWMGREIYKGLPNQGRNYHSGVRMGAFGLMLNSIILGFTSMGIEKLCRKWGAGLVWGLSNIFMALCFVAMLVISLVANNMEPSQSGLPPDGIVIVALVVFAVLGIPLAVSAPIYVHFFLSSLLAGVATGHEIYSISFQITYSVPYAMMSTRAEPLGLGQGGHLCVLLLFSIKITSPG